MYKLFRLLAVMLLMSTTLGVAAQEVHNHDNELVGKWFASSTDGSLTELQLQASGKFVFDTRSGSTIERTYMCGTWERQGESIDLDIQAQKSRLSDGEIEQAVASTRGNFEVLRSSRNTLIIRFNHSVVSFHRTTQG